MNKNEEKLISSIVEKFENRKSSLSVRHINESILRFLKGIEDFTNYEYTEDDYYLCKNIRENLVDLKILIPDKKSVFIKKYYLNLK